MNAFSWATLRELGARTADWLEGAQLEYPLHAGPAEPETEQLVPVLAQLNRSGFATTDSQPGLSTPVRQQRAFVAGVVSAEDVVRTRAAARGLWVIVAGPGEEPDASPIVAREHDVPTTWGRCISEVDAGILLIGAIGPTAAIEFRQASRVVVIDPV